MLEYKSSKTGNQVQTWDHVEVGDQVQTSDINQAECSQGDKNGTPLVETNDQEQAPHIDQIVDADEIQTPPATIDGVQTPPFRASDYLNLEDFIDGVQFLSPTVNGAQFKHPLLSLILMDLMWMCLILMVLMLMWTREIKLKKGGWDYHELSDSDDSDFLIEEDKI